MFILNIQYLFLVFSLLSSISRATPLGHAVGRHHKRSGLNRARHPDITARNVQAKGDDALSLALDALQGLANKQNAPGSSNVESTSTGIPPPPQTSAGPLTTSSQSSSSVLIASTTSTITSATSIAVQTSSVDPTPLASSSTIATGTLSSSSPPPPLSTSTAGNTTDRLVFAHFMVGIVSQYTSSSWERDMNSAKSYGIDGFALNIGQDAYTNTQLGLAYAAAEKVGFKVFISFDFHYFSTSDPAPVKAIVDQYTPLPAQFRLPSTNAAYISSFVGDGFDWQSIRSGKNLYIVPNVQVEAITNAVDGAFSWRAWPSEANKPIDRKMTVDVDRQYLGKVGGEGKSYMAPVSPWFFTHFPPEKPYAKNWLFKSETLWYDRWEQILSLFTSAPDLKYVEIVTWNDYGESHYVGPIAPDVSDDGASVWTKDMPHTALMDFAGPYIKAFKAGLSEPVIDREMLVYWYRPMMKDIDCDGTDACHTRPDGWQFVKDTVFVASFSKTGGSVKVTSGGKVVEKDIGAGVTMMEFDMAVGDQTFEMTTSTAKLSGKSAQPILGSCWNGASYNFNIYSGMLA